MFRQPPSLSSNPRWVYDDPSGVSEPAQKPALAAPRGGKARLRLVTRSTPTPATPKAA